MVKTNMSNDSQKEDYNETESMIKIVTKPEDIKILVDPMRRKILTALREGIEEDDGTLRKEMTVPEIAYRKLGLKELWTLKWHRQFDVSGPWTRAGGVQLEDWPEWMGSFKDY